MKKQKILVAEDEMDIQELVRYNLQKSGYDVESALDGEAALLKARTTAPDLILLDIMMPKLDGITVCKRLKADSVTSGIPVIMLTARVGEKDIVTGLESGASDYITKPFSMPVLNARVRACLRKAYGSPDAVLPVVKYRAMEIDPQAHLARVRNERIDLTATEFRLIYFLAQNPGRVYSRDQLLDAVRGDDCAVTERAVDVQVVGLRKKLGEYGSYVETVRGFGYRLKEV